ncbi:MAG: DUF1150 family protein, partial [Pseudomonadota bacterium]
MTTNVRTSLAATPQVPTPQMSTAQLAVLGEGHVAYVRRMRSEEVQEVFPDAPELEPGHHIWALL